MFRFHSKLPPSDLQSKLKIKKQLWRRSKFCKPTLYAVKNWFTSAAFVNSLKKHKVRNHRQLKPQIYVVKKWWIKDGLNLGNFGMKPSICSRMLGPPGQLNDLWFYTRRSSVLVAVVGWKPAKCVRSHKLSFLCYKTSFRRPKGHETDSFACLNNQVNFETTLCGLPLTTASLFQSLSETVCPRWDSSWKGDWRFSMGTLLGSWPKPTVTADKGRRAGGGGHWMWKPVWLISNRWEGGGTLLCLAVTLHPAQSVGEGSSGPQPGRTMKALQA